MKLPYIYILNYKHEKNVKGKRNNINEVEVCKGKTNARRREGEGRGGEGRGGGGKNTPLSW